MARLIEATSRTDAYMLSGFVASEETRDLLDKRRDEFIERIHRNGGSRYVERFESRRKNIDLDRIAREVINFNRTVKATMMDERIYALRELVDFCTATTAMREIILSDPEINRQFTNHAIEGWGMDRDVHGYKSPEDRHDNPYYRAITNGMAVRNSEGHYEWTTYLGSDDFDGLQLSYDEKRSALDSIERAKYLLSLGEEDPTSLAGEYL